MASISDLYSTTDYTFSSDFSGLPVPAVPGGAAAMWGTTTTNHDQDHDKFMVPIYGGTTTTTSTINGLVDYGLMSSSTTSPSESFVSNSSSSSSFLPEQLGIPDGVLASTTAAALFSDQYYKNNINNMGLHGINSGVLQNFGLGSCNYNNGLTEFGEECCATSFLPEFIKPVSLVAGDKNWGIQSSQMHAIEESNMMKVGRYSEEERKERIVRYLKKRNQRNFNKTIKYACRKTLADRRVRVRGRFARNNELCDHHQQMVAKNSDDLITRKDIDSLCCENSVQIKYDDEEDWLQDFALCCWVNGGS